MKIGFVVNDIETEKPEYTTNRLAMTAKEMGHEAWYMGIGDFAYEPDGSLSATKARAGTRASPTAPSSGTSRTSRSPTRSSSSAWTSSTWSCCATTPPTTPRPSPWANNAGVGLRPADRRRRGVLVVNDPTSLADALSKAYFQHFPEIVRPRTLISRDEDMIAAVHQGSRRQGRAQAPAGIGRCRGVPGRQQGGAQPHPDHRGHLPRRLRRGAGVPARGGQTATCGCS